MYNANASYEKNYELGPQAEFNSTQRLPRLRYLEEPRFKVWDLPLHIPCGIPAGPLLNSKFIKAALDAGFCVPTYKTVRSNSWKSHPFPNVVRVQIGSKDLQSVNRVGEESAAHLGEMVGVLFEASDYPKCSELSITNSFGVPSQNSEVWSRDVAENFPLPKGQLVGLSFQGSRWDAAPATFEALIADSVLVALQARKALQEIEDVANMAFLEINLSCPNEKGAPLFSDAHTCAKLLCKVQQELRSFETHNGSEHLKLVAKIGYLDAAHTLNWIEMNHKFIDGVSAINTIPANVRSDVGGVILGVGQLHAGVCGQLIRPFGLQMIKNLDVARKFLGLRPEKFALFGVGGAMNASHVSEYLAAGADLVQAATGAMWHLELAAEVASSLGVAHKLSY